MRVIGLYVAILLLFPAVAAAQQPAEAFEVTARLIKIPGKFPPDDLYDYAFVMKYKVQGGKLGNKELLVAHYKPLRPRQKINDKMKKHVGGKLKRFKEGALHKMTLTPRLRKIWKGPLVDKFFATDRKSVRHWCLVVNPAR